MTLKPCPFCGSDDVHISLYNHPSITCYKCWCLGPKGPRLAGGKVEDMTIEEARRIAHERWNQRATP